SPTRRLEPLFGFENVELRFIESLEQSLLRAGDAMLLTLIMDCEIDQPPPMLRLQRTIDGGLFDRLLDNLAAISANAADTLTAPEHLDRYRTNSDEDQEDEDEEEPIELAEPSRGADIPPPHRAGSAGTSLSSEADEQTQRRWPRRPH
ncbi:MAG: hypothetical protein JO240_18360, partial [Solirubrobacterales bacterium]|nr:hypothetical protein [Solirubrobacterales bacterium]